MKQFLAKAVIKTFDRLGLEIKRKRMGELDFPRDFEQDAIQIIQSVKPYTMTCDEKVHCLISAVKYVVKNQIPGAFVECGVFAGGSVMTMAKTLLGLRVLDRPIYLYDTFEGMPQPGAEDISSSGKSAITTFNATKLTPTSSDWVNASIESVRRNLALVDYPEGNYVFVKGRVEETLPREKPERIAILRLDTDFYSSTKCELEELFPRLSKGGVVIFDDYGHWLGSRKAIDEYFEKNQTAIFLNRIDFSGRVAIKQ